MMKKRLFILALILILSTIVIVNAKEEISVETVETPVKVNKKLNNDINTEININNTVNLGDEEPFRLEKSEDGETDFETQASHLVINDESINSSGSKWDQPKGYDSYHIYVKNNRNEKMKVTVSYEKKSWDFEVEANDDETYYVDNASFEKHYVDYQTSGGLVSGKISVRVSDVPFK